VESLSSDEIKRILSEAMETQFTTASPTTRHFFEHEDPSDDQPNTVTIHQWVVGVVQKTDSYTTVVELANSVVKEVVMAADKVTDEVIFGVSNLLPYQPVWLDGSTLFATHTKVGGDRFGLKDGNFLISSGSLLDDVETARYRLYEMDQSLKENECLQFFCTKSLKTMLVKACVNSRIPCRVFVIPGNKARSGWVITRDKSACSLLIDKSHLGIPIQGNKIVVGARFVVWINNPRLAVYMKAVN
jgi:hypothetical protein